MRARDEAMAPETHAAAPPPGAGVLSPSWARKVERGREERGGIWDFGFGMSDVGCRSRRRLFEMSGGVYEGRAVIPALARG
jgi:hypothetical protein